MIQSDLSSLQLNYNDLKDASTKALSEMESEVTELKCQLEFLHTKLPTKAHEMNLKKEILLQTESTWGNKLATLLNEIEVLKVSEANLISENHYLKLDLSRIKEDAETERAEIIFSHEKKI